LRRKWDAIYSVGKLKWLIMNTPYTLSRLLGAAAERDSNSQR
jgi:hypothetical protein